MRYCFCHKREFVALRDINMISRDFVLVNFVIYLQVVVS
jgi:hypothetical protein